jgi:hypothetical protein
MAGYCLFEHPIGFLYERVITRLCEINILFAMNNVIANLANSPTEKLCHVRYWLLDFGHHAVIPMIDARRLGNERVGAL